MLIKNSSVVMQPFGILCASSRRFFIGYWILQRGWVSTRPLLFLRCPDEDWDNDANSGFWEIFFPFTIVSCFHFRIAIVAYIKGKDLIHYTRDLDQYLRSFLKCECPAPAYNPAIKGIPFRLLHFLLQP